MTRLVGMSRPLHASCEGALKLQNDRRSALGSPLSARESRTQQIWSMICAFRVADLDGNRLRVFYDLRQAQA
jgi:hypothetical protein